jgi:hypothetical protein
MKMSVPGSGNKKPTEARFTWAIPVSAAKDIGYRFNKGLLVFNKNVGFPYLMT